MDNFINYVDQAADSAVPPWIFSSVLLYKGLTSTRPIDAISGSSGGSAKLARSLAIAKPTKASCYTFGLTHLIGGYMIYDQDVENGAGFTFAWSSLYLLVNGKASIKSIFSGRVSPIGLSVFAMGNVFVYGREFFWPRKRLE